MFFREIPIFVAVKAEREHLTEVFAELGRRLRDFGDEGQSRHAIERATAANPWFTPESIVASVESIREQMLDGEKLRRWVAAYPAPDTPRSVGLITAGNIPLVGFFDMLCVLISGHRLFLRASSKDSVMMQFMTDKLRDIDPALSIAELADDSPIDAVIATGSDNTNRYFRSRYATIPALLRGSRSSVAVLGGDETAQELEGLASDIFSYSGLGCRNVSHLLVPGGYDFAPLETALRSYGNINPKYINNYRQRAAMLSIQGYAFSQGPFYILREDAGFPAYISEITWHTSEGGLTESWLREHDPLIQCVVGRVVHPRQVAFGRSQCPSLTDYPDAVDVMEFLAGIQFGASKPPKQ